MIGSVISSSSPARRQGPTLNLIPIAHSRLTRDQQTHCRVQRGPPHGWQRAAQRSAERGGALVTGSGRQRFRSKISKISAAVANARGVVRTPAWCEQLLNVLRGYGVDVMCEERAPANTVASTSRPAAEHFRKFHLDTSSPAAQHEKKHSSL